MNVFKNQLPVKSNLSNEEISRVIKQALTENNLFNRDDTAVMFFDLSFIKARINSIQQAFPVNSLHAVAAKANPLIRLLSWNKACGCGLEVASLPELYLAKKAGFIPEEIVFDSPCKTREEIEYALREGVYINADSFDELDRIAEIQKSVNTKSTIGLRLNPQVGTGSIKPTSVAGVVSKFGVPINENRERIITYYLEHDWLKGMHVHIGSQGCPLNMLVIGIRKVLDLATEINTRRKQAAKKPVVFFDIGGGLPISYHADKEPVTMNQYATMLRETCPELFTGEFRVITEFGRYIYANAGWVASRVEYVKREQGYNIVMIHVGADLFLRKCYNPGDWHHQITVVDKKGKLKSGTDTNKYTIAGPLCFAGDVVATDLSLPLVEEGDYIIIHDAGAYTLSMWSRYNSRQIPKVIGYDAEKNLFETLKERETTADLMNFWI